LPFSSIFALNLTLIRMCHKRCILQYPTDYTTDALLPQV